MEGEGNRATDEIAPDNYIPHRLPLRFRPEWTAPPSISILNRSRGLPDHQHHPHLCCGGRCAYNHRLRSHTVTDADWRRKYRNTHHVSTLCLCGYSPLWSIAGPHGILSPRIHSFFLKEHAPTKVQVTHHRNTRHPHPIHDVQPLFPETTKPVHVAQYSSHDAFQKDQGRTAREKRNERGRRPV